MQHSHMMQSGTGIDPPYDQGHGMGMQQQQQQQRTADPASLQRQRLLQEQLTHVWNVQWKEMEQAKDFRSHNLPLARIKKIMKSDEDVRMISAEAPIVFAKACEMFILELTLRSWRFTEENKRRTLQRSDVAQSIAETEIFDFLLDIVPPDEKKGK
eukprot:SAG22_NODE_392_length_11210_cov_3.879669_1_plen_155_part_10